MHERNLLGRPALFVVSITNTSNLRERLAQFFQGETKPRFGGAFLLEIDVKAGIPVSNNSLPRYQRYRGKRGTGGAVLPVSGSGR